MEKLDEFASMFKRAQREPFRYEAPPLNTIVLVTQNDAEHAQQLQTRTTTFLTVLQSAREWHFVTGEQFHNVGELIDRLDGLGPDLVITQRHLDEESLVPQHSLGVYVDVLTQVMRPPVLLLPGEAYDLPELPQRPSRNVMVVTDHISGENRLINHGVAWADGRGEVWLCHVEDDAVFDRYIDAISRIPEIDTEEARVLLQRQLSKDASDFIETCLGEVKPRNPEIRFHCSIGMGHLLKEYRQLVESHDIDLLVFHTKDEDQLAMHGIGYALSVELNQRCLLLL